MGNLWRPPHFDGGGVANFLEVWRKYSCPMCIQARTQFHNSFESTLENDSVKQAYTCVVWRQRLGPSSWRQLLFTSYIHQCFTSVSLRLTSRTTCQCNRFMHDRMAVGCASRAVCERAGKVVLKQCIKDSILSGHRNKLGLEMTLFSTNSMEIAAC